jgi:hypothetical protein
VKETVRAGLTGELIAVHQDLCFAKGQAGTAAPGRPRREAHVPRQFELPDSKRELTNVGVYPLGLNRACLIGRRAAAVFDADRPRVEVWADVEPWTAPRRDPEDPMGMWATPRPQEFTPRPKQAWIVPSPLRANDDIKRFLDCIEEGRASDVPAALGAEATEVLLAAYRSAATRQVVTLPLPRGEER